MDYSRRVEISTAAGLSIALALLVALVSQLSSQRQQSPIQELAQAPITVFPDFVSIQQISVKKNQFFDFLQDYVVAENQTIEAQRKQLLSYADVVNSGVGLSGLERQWVMDLATSYRIEARLGSDKELVSELVHRVDVIPVSLVLAQAANESAWGTSRFALEVNNIFGQWCYEPGCGVVPRRRVSGATHEVKRFASVEESVQAYFLNINSHHLYSDLRDLRAQLRMQYLDLDPMILARGLDRYSERGEHYVDEVQNIIIQNDLQKRDRLSNSIASVNPLH